jgi:hypothetical protein
MLYEAPRPHVCEWPHAAPGSVWRCGECGGHWRMQSIGLMNAPGWYPMGRLAVWRWKRRAARKG